MHLATFRVNVKPFQWLIHFIIKASFVISFLLFSMFIVIFVLMSYVRCLLSLLKGQFRLRLNLKYLKLCSKNGLIGLERREGEALMTSFSFLGQLTL